MNKLANIALLSAAALLAAPAEVGSDAPKAAKKSGGKSKAKTETAPAPAAVEAPKKSGKQPVFADKTKIVEALTFLRANDMAGFTAAGFSMHHVRQLGKGVSGGVFGPGAGLGYVEMVADTSERPEGAKGRRPLVPSLTAEGKKFLQIAELNAKRKAAKAAKDAPATESAPQETVAADTTPETPSEAPATETVAEQAAA